MEAVAAVLYEPGSPLRIETVTVLPPGPGEVQVRLHAAGVCHSDLHVMKGDQPMKMPIILGHEGSGVVEAVGDGVASVEPGDHVIPIWRMSCGICEYCLGGRPVLCDVGTKMRFTGRMPDGKTRFQTAGGREILHYAGVSTFSQLSTMPEGAVVRIPKDFPLEFAALIGCGVITGFGAVFNAAGLAAGDTAAVFGCGGIGLNIVQSAKLAGAVKIIAVDTVPKKLEYAKQFGATHVVDATESDPVEAIHDLTGNQGVDFAFEAVGLAGPIEKAYDSTKKGGTCVVVGIAPPSARAGINVNALVYAEKTLKGSLYGSTRPRIDLLRLIDLHAAGRLMLDELLTRTYPLDQINEAYADLEKGEVARSLVLCNA
ncbi:MAG: Zn-dependent alcohol dehydrogenase [Verrucomicrobiales bacterium]